MIYMGMKPGALERFVEEIKKKYGKRIKKVILFGSYARGEQTLESDIDILILIDKEDFRLRRAIVDLSFDYFLKYRVDISPKVISKEDFKENLQYPFMKAVEEEGKALA
jgi:predicted nucleotidyltransferase